MGADRREVRRKGPRGQVTLYPFYLAATVRAVLSSKLVGAVHETSR
jgi:hypothetical protein